MPVSEQGIVQGQYMLVPRTATFLRQGSSYLLLRGSAHKRRWPGLYNGIGGHLQRGEDAMSCAVRELREETGLEADLWLCGTVIVDAGEAGVGLFVFSGIVTGGALHASPEGAPAWIPYEELSGLPAVEDLQAILDRIHRMRRGDPPFSARSFYDHAGRLQLIFSS